MKTKHSIPTVCGAAAFCLLFLGGCTVGPKYKPPTTPAPPAYKESAPEAYKTAAPGAWQPAQPQDSLLKGKWWEIFNEPELNALEEQLNINNQNIAQYFPELHGGPRPGTRGPLQLLSYRNSGPVLRPNPDPQHSEQHSRRGWPKRYHRRTHETGIHHH